MQILIKNSVRYSSFAGVREEAVKTKQPRRYFASSIIVRLKKQIIRSAHIMKKLLKLALLTILTVIIASGTAYAEVYFQGSHCCPR